ncbi:multidrug ABC transporter ATP-binding protein [Vibrio albus]|uniref:Multidrug ABC transporter ATP-binding protein n=1 Tax=Vibrio albus TaxID=2200953 RepID=A0A2U3BBC3_9VIBR|nr:ATP-binding cassette domain-containing protein [Vibrio albus]PWI34035.1 multidrug ABC transporter ATP-binding protein [Vibrio albus]
MTSSSISIAGLNHFFDPSETLVLRDINAEIYPGRITGLVGPDGAGKTTLIRLMSSLLVPCEGNINTCGYNSRTETISIRERIGYMPQRFGLYEDLTVLENLTLYAELRSVFGPEREDTFERLLTFTDLKKFTGRLAGRLSGGMKQKLGLACALIRKPQVLLLDEPSVGVDPISRRELWHMVRELADEQMAVVWSTAYLDEAEQCEEVMLLNEGRLLFTGLPGEMTRRVDGRVFQVRGIQAEEKRPVLTRLLDSPCVLDGIVQGAALRLLVRKDVGNVTGQLELPDGAELQAVMPNFEDAFMDMLGGGPGGRSVLAEQYDERVDDGQPIVEAQGLTKRFKDFVAVHDNSFSIRRGEIFGLLGPNGAGKSTTFKMMCGLLRPTEGMGKVAGINLRHAASKARNRLGYMAQKFSLYSGLSVYENLRFFSGVYGLRGKEQQQAIERMLEVFELYSYQSAEAGTLPLGFRQRLSLACAMMHKPDVLFLDEPTSGVDPVTRREFWNHINGLVQKGVTVLVTTHFMDEAEYCDRIGLIYRSEKIAEGTPEDLKRLTTSGECPDPTLEDAFIMLVHSHDKKAYDREE